MALWIDENDHDEPLTPEETAAARRLIENRAAPDLDATARVLMHLAAPLALILMVLGAFGKFLWDQVMK